MGLMRAGVTNKTTKGYPRVTAGPLRHQYVHRIVAAALIGRQGLATAKAERMRGNAENATLATILQD